MSAAAAHCVKTLSIPASFALAVLYHIANNFSIM